MSTIGNVLYVGTELGLVSLLSICGGLLVAKKIAGDFDKPKDPKPTTKSVNIHPKF